MPRPSDAWRDNALCRSVGDINIFYPTSRHRWRLEVALTICRSCPVKTECLATQLSYPPSQRHGVWGGKLFSRHHPEDDDA